MALHLDLTPHLLTASQLGFDITEIDPKNISSLVRKMKENTQEPRTQKPLPLPLVGRHLQHLGQEPDDPTDLIVAALCLRRPLGKVYLNPKDVKGNAKSGFTRNNVTWGICTTLTAQPVMKAELDLYVQGATREGFLRQGSIGFNPERMDTICDHIKEQTEEGSTKGIERLMDHFRTFIEGLSTEELILALFILGFAHKGPDSTPIFSIQLINSEAGSTSSNEDTLPADGLGFMRPEKIKQLVMIIQADIERDEHAALPISNLLERLQPFDGIPITEEEVIEAMRQAGFADTMKKIGDDLHFSVNINWL